MKSSRVAVAAAAGSLVLNLWKFASNTKSLAIYVSTHTPPKCPFSSELESWQFRILLPVATAGLIWPWLDWMSLTFPLRTNFSCLKPSIGQRWVHQCVLVLYKVRVTTLTFVNSSAFVLGWIGCLRTFGHLFRISRISTEEPHVTTTSYGRTTSFIPRPASWGTNYSMISVHSVPNESTISIDCSDFDSWCSKYFKVIHSYIKFVKILAFRTFNVLAEI